MILGGPLFAWRIDMQQSMEAALLQEFPKKPIASIKAKAEECLPGFRIRMA
jgi:hypothetical protein